MNVCVYMSACVGIYMCGCVLVCIFLYACIVVILWWLNSSKCMNLSQYSSYT